MSETDAIINNRDENETDGVVGMFESISFLMERCSTENVEQILELCKSKLGKSETVSEKVLALLEQITDQSELEKIGNCVSEKMKSCNAEDSFGVECAKRCAKIKANIYKGYIMKGIEECMTSRTASCEFHVCPHVRDTLVKYLEDQGFVAEKGYYDSEIKMTIIPHTETFLKCLGELTEKKDTTS